MPKKKRNKVLFILAIIVLSLTVVVFLTLNYYGNRPRNIGISNTKTISAVDESKIKAIIVPHHDLMKDERAKLFAAIKSKTTPKTVILVSPNHFSTGTADILTTDRTWQLGDGRILPDQNKISTLLQSNVLSKDDGAFNGEHGVVNILDDIHNTFPEAAIIPIVMRQNGTADRVEALGQALNDACKNGSCLLVASVDCSHYQPGSLSEIHDDMTIRSLNNMDQKLSWQAEVDSNQSLSLLIEWAKLNDANNFNLFQNTNSAKLANARDGEATSYVLGWYEKGAANPLITDETSFIFAGDMMMGRGVDYSFRGTKIYDLFSNFGNRVFWGTDLAMANLEGPISQNVPSPENGTDMVMNFPPTVPKVLDWLHLNAVGLANNHTLNQGKVGLKNTIDVLKAAGITPIGRQAGFDDSSISHFGSGSSKISVIAIESLEVNKDLSQTIQSEISAGYKVIIYPHWGVEYATTHSADQAKLAHSWIDAGADLIIGSHPHVVQDAEMYKSKPIFYSLGNFVFDQSFSTETEHGLIVAGEFKSNKLDLVILPTVQIKTKPELQSGDDKTDFITKIRQELGLPSSDTGYGYDKIEIEL